MEASVSGSENTQFPLKLMLFIDKRPSSNAQVRQIRKYLKTLEEHFDFDLDVIDVGEQPYLVEHYKLVASPALIKIAPPPQQMIAGSNLTAQLERLWPRWHREAASMAKADESVNGLNSTSAPDGEAAGKERSYSAEIMRLSDEIFRQNQTIAELEAQLRFKNRIIAMLAHDLRNPLTAASIAIETLEMGHGSNRTRSYSLSSELTGQLLKHAKTQIRSIDRMVTDILKAAQGASAQLHIQPQRLDLRALCMEVIDSFQERLTAASQVLAFDLPQDLPAVDADPVQVRRVLTNLLDNAIKYIPQKGQIEVTAIHRTTQKVQVAIQDTGPGIPKEKQEKIFEESYRLKRDQSKDGYGLGLALCQRIIRAHYGQIWVDSTLGEGSCFYFTLPVYRD